MCRVKGRKSQRWVRPSKGQQAEMMRFKLMVAALAGALTCGSAATAQVPAKTKSISGPDPAAVPAAAGPALAEQEVDRWLGGFVPYALSSGDIAGAVGVVVKDGQVLTERGYGYADVKARRK